MSSPVTSSSLIQPYLLPGLKLIFGSYNTQPELFSAIYSTHKADMQVEFESESVPLPPASVQGEGQSVSFAATQAFTTWSFPVVGVSSATMLTRIAIEDNLYKNEFPRLGRSMRASLLQTKNTISANILNNAFSNTYVGGDQKPLCSTSHPTLYGSYSNTFDVATQLSESAIQDAWVVIQNFVDAAGIRQAIGMEKIIIPPALEWTANFLLASKYRPFTGNNEVNNITSIDGGMLKGGYSSNIFLTQETAWFIKCRLDGADGGMRHYVREPVWFNIMTDPNNFNVSMTAYERYCFGWSNPRAIFGSAGM